MRCLDLSPPHPQQWLEFATDNFIIIASFFAVCKSIILKTSLPLKTWHSSPLTWFSGRMNEGDSSLWSDHDEPSEPHLSGLGGIILISDHHQPVPGVVTSDNLSPDSRERRAQRPHSPGREINCLNKNLHPDQLCNRCPEAVWHSYWKSVKQVLLTLLSMNSKYKVS